MSEFYKLWTVTLFVALLFFFIGYILAIAILTDWVIYRDWKTEFEEILKKHYLY